MDPTVNCQNPINISGVEIWGRTNGWLWSPQLECTTHSSAYKGIVDARKLKKKNVMYQEIQICTTLAANIPPQLVECVYKFFSFCCLYFISLEEICSFSWGNLFHTIRNSNMEPTGSVRLMGTTSEQHVYTSGNETWYGSGSKTHKFWT
jgi:hypothetical protein